MDSLSASSIVFTISSYATFISRLPFSCQGAKADPVFEMPSCSLVGHQSIWRCPVGVLALTKVYLEMENCCAFWPQQTQCFTVIKGRNRTVHLYVVNEQKQLNDQELYRLLFGIFFFPSDSKCWLSSKSSTLEGAEIISLSCRGTFLYIHLLKHLFSKIIIRVLKFPCKWKQILLNAVLNQLPQLPAEVLPHPVTTLFYCHCRLCCTK